MTTPQDIGQRTAQPISRRALVGIQPRQKTSAALRTLRPLFSSPRRTQSSDQRMNSGDVAALIRTPWAGPPCEFQHLGPDAASQIGIDRAPVARRVDRRCCGNAGRRIRRYRRRICPVVAASHDGSP